MWKLYGKALLKKDRPGEPGHQSLMLAGISPDAASVRRYNRVCGFTDSGRLAPTFLHTLAFPLHLSLLTGEAMPFRPLGVVHIRNSIQQYRPVEDSEELDICCSLGDSRPADAGIEFDIHTRVEVSGSPVWESISTNLKRQVKNTVNKNNHVLPQPFQNQQCWKLASGLGRQYAWVSGDINPIHLWPLSARMFGFQRQIIHGMWSKARCLAALNPLLGQSSFTVNVDFKTPAFLPSEVDFSYLQTDSHIDFLLRSVKTGKPHIGGTVDIFR